jgi:small ligand-binding sensory domain FIST
MVQQTMVDSIPVVMKWAGAISTRPSLEAAVTEVVEQAQARLQTAPTLGFVFISSTFASEYPRLMPLLQENLPQVPLLGCGGRGVIGMSNPETAREIEDDIAISLTLATLPDVNVQFFHVETDTLPDLDSPPHAWVDLIGVPVESQAQFVILVDPMSGGINDLLAGLDYAYPGCSKVGGLASNGMGGSSGGLFCGRHYYRSGVVGVALSGNLTLDTIVAQGCRPIGQPYWITESERNIILGMRSDGEDSSNDSPLDLLREMVQRDLNPTDQELAKQSLFVGIAQNAFKQPLASGDFLVRNLLGFDPRNGALAIGDRIRTGQRIQFHLRDAEASADDLDMLLKRYRHQIFGQPAPAGALLFSCLGRGTDLYGRSNFDSGLFAEYMSGTVPLGGVFCNGEIGPVGSATFLHGYTSVFGIFRPKVISSAP